MGTTCSQRLEHNEDGERCTSSRQRYCKILRNWNQTSEKPHQDDNYKQTNSTSSKGFKSWLPSQLWFPHNHWYCGGLLKNAINATELACNCRLFF